MGHTAVSAIKASSVTLLYLAKGAKGKFNKAAVSKTDINRKLPKYFSRKLQGLQDPPLRANCRQSLRCKL